MTKKPSSYSFDEPAPPDEEKGEDVIAPSGEAPPAAAAPLDTPPVHDGPVLATEEARQLLRSGNKLGVIGNPVTDWFTTARRLDEMVLATPYNQDVEDKLLVGVDVCLVVG